jgi:hypothetical protein
MNHLRTFVLLTLLAMPAVLSGCGSGSGAPATQVTALQAATACINCHGTAKSPGTGLAIIDEWQRSTHNTANAASCRDCHDPAPGHPNNCSLCHNGAGTNSQCDVSTNPDKDQKCFKCHGPNHPTDVMIANAPQHFNNMTAGYKFPASYVSSRYVGRCRACHNPHDPTTNIAINKQWAASGLGDTTSGARVNYDFKTRGTYEPVNLSFQYFCVRCHTTTGFINYVKSGFSDQTPFAGPGYAVVQNIPGVAEKNSPDKSKEVTNCDACHDDASGRTYSFKLRSVPPVRVYYNYSAAGTNPTVKINDNNSLVFYPDAGPSNMCIPCHAGRGTGQLIKTAAGLGLNFQNASRIGGHDFSGGATLFKQSGYEYAGRDYSTPAHFYHDRIGLANFQGTGSKGPCITCHMNSDESHSFMPVKFKAIFGTISSISSKSCEKCHFGPIAWTPEALQAKKFGFRAALAALQRLQIVKGIFTVNVSSSGAVSYSTTKKWAKPANAKLYANGTGPDSMGASFNYDVLKNDWGCFAHNSIYVKRLIYDAIDWLNDGVLNNDVEAAINALTFPDGTAVDPVSGKTYRTADPVTNKAYSDSELASLKATVITYLLGAPGGARP